MNREIEQSPIEFVDMPDRLPGDANPQAQRAYDNARRRMYKAQLEAAEIAARECWPADYHAAKQEFQRKLLDLFSMRCNSYKR